MYSPFVLSHSIGSGQIAIVILGIVAMTFLYLLLSHVYITTSTFFSPNLFDAIFNACYHNYEI